MATFSLGYNFIVWTGPTTTLKTAPWIVNVEAVYDLSANRSAFISFKPTASFPAVTQLTAAASGATPRVYLMKVKTVFSLDDALVGLVVISPPASNTELLIGQNNLSRNLRAIGNTSHSALSGFSVATNAPYFDVVYAARAPAQPPLANFGLCSFVNNAVSEFFPVVAAGPALVQRFTPAGTGTRTIEITEGIQASDSTGEPVSLYCRVDKVLIPNGYTGTLLPALTASDVLIANTDSIGVGTSSTNPQVNGWIGCLKALRPNLLVYSDGWAYKRVAASIGTAAQRKTIVANALQTFGSAATKRYVIALGTNDMRSNIAAQATMSLIEALVDELHAADNTIEVYVQLLLNYGGDGLTQQYRDAANALVAGRGTWFRTIDCGTVSLADQNHPTDGGYVSMAQSYHAQLRTLAVGLNATPLEGDIGTLVTLRGEAFTGASAVTLNGVTLAYKVVNDSTITLTVPNTASSGYFKVVRPDGDTITASQFTVKLSAPRNTLIIQDSNLAIRYLSGNWSIVTGSDPNAYGDSVYFNSGGDGIFEVTVPTGFARLIMEGFSDTPCTSFEALVNGKVVGTGNQMKPYAQKAVYYEFDNLKEGDICRLHGLQTGQQLFADQFRFEP